MPFEFCLSIISVSCCSHNVYVFATRVWHIYGGSCCWFPRKKTWLKQKCFSTFVFGDVLVQKIVLCTLYYVLKLWFQIHNFCILIADNKLDGFPSCNHWFEDSIRLLFIKLHFGRLVFLFVIFLLYAFWGKQCSIIAQNLVIAIVLCWC